MRKARSRPCLASLTTSPALTGAVEGLEGGGGSLSSFMAERFEAEEAGADARASPGSKQLRGRIQAARRAIDESGTGALRALGYGFPPLAACVVPPTVRNACMPIISCGSQTISYVPSANRVSITSEYD
jgi:hypothetical protein